MLIRWISWFSFLEFILYNLTVIYSYVILIYVLKINKTRQIFIHLLIKRTLKFCYKYFFVYFQNDTSNLVEFQVKPNFQCHAFYPVAYIISIVAPIIIYWLRIPFLWCLCNCIFLVSNCYTIFQNGKMIDTCHFLLHLMDIWIILLLLFEVYFKISFLILIRKKNEW